ncbi:hypothetical protein G7Y89_g6903 [Cudoniella acicularis]|uniref:Uncharacterized protein n=1 Tax=Cudoniella acicularis TaxID=354080 RepID=A0A8H4RLE5_9HELO|nr:hypothetical protein G7Y89_g6903 [Cudoniella acicularis]
MAATNQNHQSTNDKGAANSEIGSNNSVAVHIGSDIQRNDSPSNTHNTTRIQATNATTTKTSTHLTRNALATHEHIQASFWADPAKVTSMREEEYRKIRKAAKSFGVDITATVFDKMVDGPVGKTPMERMTEGEG